MQDPGSGALYHALIETLPDAVLVTEEGSARNALANAAATRLLGYSREELLTLGPADLAAPDEWPRRRAARAILRERGEWRGQWRLRRKDGSFVPTEATMNRLVLGGRVWYRGQFRDITERKAAEAALRQSQAGLQRESERLLALHRASNALAAQAAEPDTVLDEVLRNAVALLGSSSAALYRWDAEADMLRLVHKWNVPVSRPSGEVRSGQGLAGQTFARGEPLIVNDYAAWEFATPNGLRAGIRAGLGVPLRHGGRPIGVLLIRSYGDDATRFTEDDARLVTLFGDQAAAALENARLYRDLAVRLERSRALTRTNRLISSSLDMDDLLREIAAAAAQLIDDAVVSFWVADEAAEQLHARAFSGATEGVSPVQTMRFGEGAAGWVAAHRQALCIPDVFADGRFARAEWWRAHGLRSFYGVPVILDGALLAVLALSGRQPFRLTADDEDLLESFVAQAAVAIRNASLYAALNHSNRALEEAVQRANQMALAAGAAERAARESEERFRSLVQNSSDVITVVDVDTTIRYQTPSVERVFGYSGSRLIGTKLLDLIHDDDVPRAALFFAELTRSSGVTAPVPWRLRHRNGRWLCVETVGTNLLQHPTVSGLVLNTRDVSERQALEERLTEQAFCDPLTGLANRVLFRDRVEQALIRARRDDTALAVLFLDLDNFKTVNDSLGHEAGDELLVAVAGRLDGCVRAGDTAARLGGDEFAVLVEQAAGWFEPALLADRVLEALRAPFVPRGKEVFVSASIGIAASGGCEDADELLRNADVAMYMAKSKGKGRAELFETRMHAAALERLELEADLRNAVERQEFVVHYQPILTLESGGVAGLEAVVRWNHPTRGLVPPGEFIPLAEETGLIVPLGRQVLRRATAQVAAWQAEYPSESPLDVGVNISVRHLQHPTLVADVADALRDSGLAPGSLTLEITESVMLHDPESIAERLQELKALGVRLAIDDFGTGYSSLRYLQGLPIDILKIDRSFVAGIADGRDGNALVQAIITLANSFELVTVAEGIERAEQLERLRALGCDLGQGYYFARPLPSERVSGLLAAPTTPPTAPPAAA